MGKRKSIITSTNIRRSEDSPPVAPTEHELAVAVETPEKTPEKDVTEKPSVGSQKFVVRVVDMSGVPVRDIRVGAWDASITSPTGDSLIVNELTDDHGSVVFYHDFPPDADLYVRCRDAKFTTINSIIKAGESPLVVTVDYEVHSRHLPAYRSQYV